MKNSPASPSSFLSSCNKSCAKSALLMSGSSKACINRVKALGPLFSSTLSMVCVPVVAPCCKVFYSISSKSAGLNIDLRYTDKTTGFEILFIISEDLFARTFREQDPWSDNNYSQIFNLSVYPAVLITSSARSHKV